jgi:hypothetical protein
MSVKHISIANTDDSIIDEAQLRKMKFIWNAIEKGWAVKKRDDSYIFSKKHEGKREIFMDTYLETFIAQHFTDT